MNSTTRTNNVITIDRARGSLLAGACGDALGRPAEGRRPSQLRDRYGLITEFEQWRHYKSGPIGTFTDDTQLTLWSAESLLASKTTDPTGLSDLHAAYFAKRLVAERPRIRGIGHATSEAIARHAQGVPMERAGSRSAGNGAAMRAAPFGLALSGVALRQAVAANARSTHNDDMAVAGAIILATAVRMAAQTDVGTLNPKDFLAELVSRCQDLADRGTRERKPGAGPERVRLIDRIAELDGFLDAKPWEAFDHTHNGAFVLESLPAALWCFLRYPEDLEQAVITAVMGGYDADTVAAMAGNVAGAYLGESAIPSRWLDELERRDEIGRLAEALVGGRRGGPKRRGSRKRDVGAGSNSDADVGAGSDAPLHISVLLDASGSMRRLKRAAISGFNEFIDTQRKVPGEVTVSLAQFNSHKFTQVFEEMPLAEIPRLGTGTLHADGATPLFDSIARTIKSADYIASRQPQAGTSLPLEHLVIIISDGLENASSKVNEDQVAAMIADREELGWTFVYMCSDARAYEAGNAFGAREGNISRFDTSDEGFDRAWESVGRAARSYRGKSRFERQRDRGDWFEGRREAEDR